MKVCGDCGKAKPRKMFSRHATRRDGLQRNCKPCAAARHRLYYREHRVRMRQQIRQSKVKRLARNRVLVYRFLLEHPCADCGETDPVVLDFDHVRGKKLAAIAEMMSQCGAVRLLREIAKCTVRCANCHRRVTAKRAGHYRWRRSRFV